MPLEDVGSVVWRRSEREFCRHWLLGGAEREHGLTIEARLLPSAARKTSLVLVQTIVDFQPREDGRGGLASARCVVAVPTPSIDCCGQASQDSRLCHT